MAVRNVESELERLGNLRGTSREEAAAALRKGLRDRVNVVAAKAARMSAELGLEELIPDLLGAFDRLFKNDPQCWGKTAIAKALAELQYREAAPFLRGMRHVQMEAVWGGQEDTAPSLRGACVLALVACTDVRRDQVLRCLVDAAGDKAVPVRIELIRALAEMGGEEGALLLRMKARLGDAEPSVVGQTFDALLALEREDALEFVGEFLKAAEETREEAALSLGSSRLPGVAALLQEAWETTTRDVEFREVLLRALSISRLPEAIEFLLGTVRDGRLVDALAALAALALQRDSAEIRRSAEEASSEREPELRDRFREKFGPTPEC